MSKFPTINTNIKMYLNCTKGISINILLFNSYRPNRNQNCTGLESQEFCATNGKTYNNTCEMNKESRLTGIDIQHEDDGPCK